jgi:RHS repeat-associated protein
MAGGVCRFVVTLLCFVITFQPSYALAGNLLAAESKQNSSAAAGGNATASHTLAALTGNVLNYVSSLFDPKDAGAVAEPSAPTPDPAPTPDHSVKDAAVSRQVPDFNSGHVNGSMRVLEGKSYSLNNGSTVSGDLYTLGNPSLIRTNHGSTYGGVVNDGGAAQPSGFRITLNHRSAITGNVHVRADAVTLPGDVPANVPAPAGTRTVNVNTAADVTGIGDWATVLDLNVNAPNVIIDVPPGNYRRIAVNAASQLNLRAGAYNFSQTLFAGAGATVRSTGYVTINCAQGFDIDGAKMTLGANTRPGDVRLNVLGDHADLFHAAEIYGLVRGLKAHVHLNHGSVVHGQVIADVLHFNNDSRINGDVSYSPPADTAPPQVVITSPSNNTTTTDASVVVRGTAADAGANASGVAQVTVNGVAAAYDAATGQWTASNVPLDAGANTITARAVDNAGNAATAAVNVTRDERDTTPPTLVVTEPADGAATDAETVNVGGTAVDSGPNASGVARVTVNGALAALGPNGSWTLPNLSLSVGANTVDVRAYDNAGNEAAKSIGVTRRAPADTQAPTLVVNSPANNSTTDAESVSFGGSASDPGAYASGVAHVFVGEREAQLDPQSGAWSLADVQLVMGLNAVVVRAVDRAGNTTPQTVNVRRVPPPDTTAPSLHVSTPSDGSSTQEETVTVSGTASDPGEFPSGVAQVTVNGRPATFDPQTGAWTLSGVGLVVGANRIDVRAVDNAGNATPQSINVTRVPPPDIVAPTVVIDAPAEGFVSPDETITVTGTAVDEGPYATGVRQVSVNGRPAVYDAATRRWTVTGVQLAEGANVVRAVAEDNSPAPNRGEAVVNVTRRTPDTRPPTVEITSPLTPFETFDETVSVAGTAVDDGLNAAGVARVTVNGRDAAFDAATGRWSISGLALAYGDNLVAVVATDSSTAANQGRAEIHVTRKQVPPPALSIVNPQNGAVLAATSITVAGNVSSMRAEGLTVTVNGEPAAVSGGQYTKTVQLAEGANTITVAAADSLGQRTQLSASVVRDLTPPTVSFANTPALVQPGGSYRINVDVADNVGVADVEFKVGGQHVETVAASPYEFTLNVPAALAAGQVLVLSAVARDLSGTTSVATAQARTTGPGAVSGYVFDDSTGYVLKGASAALGAQSSAADDGGLYSFVSASPSGLVRLSKDGYTSVERLFSVNPGEGAALFDARLTPLDAHANALDNSGGTAAGDGGRLQVRFDAGALGNAADVRVTAVSPQGLANLLPYGWSPVPGGVVDVRPASGAGALILPAHLSVARSPYLSPGTSVVLARYDEAGHGWTVVAVALTAGQDGSLAAELPAFGQYAFLVADQGATAPPPPAVGAPLTSGRPADPTALDAATATAVSTPRTATYSADARSSINFVADAPTQLPSGVAVEASFGETYRLLGGNEPLLVERPAQDFVLYAFPAASAERPNRLGAFFIAKPTRTEFTIAELIGANVHVEIRTGRQPRVGALVGEGGGQVRSGSGGRLNIPAGAVATARPVYFGDVQPDVANVQLPAGYEIVAAYDVDLSGGTLARAAIISAPAVAGDLSRVVVARVVTIGGQRGPKVVARAVEENGQLVSKVNAPAVPSGVALAGVTASGRYLFVRIADPFGYAKGAARDGAGAAAASVRVSNDRTPFVDVTGADGGFVLLGSAGAGSAGANQLSAASLVTDATGGAAATLAAQDAVADSDVTLSTTPLAVASVAPAQGAQGVVVTAPVTVTFNKPVASQSITGSSFTLTTAAGNPVLGTVTVHAGSRVVAFTPSATLAGSTAYRVTLTQAVRDIYGKPLSNVFTSTFTTAGVVRVDDRLRPERIQIRYPDADGVSRVVIPAGAVPEGSTVVAINNNSGSTASTVAGTQGLELSIQARVGDEIALVVRQPDGVEYRVTQGAYRRDDGVVSVGASGGTLTSDDGQAVLEVPAGAVTGQADIQLTTRRESDISAPREREMSPELMAFGAGVRLRATGSFTQQKELHLELNVPAGAGATEGQRVAFMRPRQLTFGGQQGTAWQTLTSGKVEGGRFKSMSPPFLGIWFDPAWWEIVVFVPRAPMRAVNGLVYQLKAGQPEEPMGGVPCTIADAASTQYPSVVAVSADNGAFSTLQTAVAYSQNVSVTCEDATGRKQYAVASPQLNIDPYKNPGLNGLSTLFAAVKFPDDSEAPDRRPAVIEIFASQLQVLNGQVVPLGPGDANTLRELGVVRVGTPVRVAVKTNPQIEDLNFKGDLYVGETKVQSLRFDKLAPYADGSEARQADFVADAEGSYSVRIETLTKTNLPSSKATARYDFLSLHNPNTRPPVAGPPTVISVTPADKSTQVDAGSRVHLEFSEPVKNLVPGTTVFITDLATGTTHGGKLTSGGVPIGPNTESISSVDFQPDPPLEGGKQYEVNVTAAVVDSTNVKLAQPFKSTFKTFTGAVLTGAGLPDSAYRIAAAGQFAVTVYNPGIGGSEMKVYDMSNPRTPSVVHQGFIPQRALAVAMAEVEPPETADPSATPDPNAPELFHVGVTGEAFSRIAVVTTHALPDIERSVNLWIYSLEDPAEPKIVGVVSLSFPSRTSSIPGQVVIHKKRAYVGTAAQGGLLVVDLEQAMNDWAQAVQRSGANFSPQHPQVKAVMPNVGFDFEAKVQSAGYGDAPTGNPSPVYAVSVIDQLASMPNLGPNRRPMPVAYVASTKPWLITMGLDPTNDGVNGFFDTNHNGRDVRVLMTTPLSPAGFLVDVRAVSGVQYKGQTIDVAVGLGAERLWIFNATNPNQPTQYTSRTLAELGFGDAGYARRMEVEGTFAYIIFANKVGVVDFSDPERPIRVSTITNVGDDLRWISVKDGFVYTLSGGTGERAGLNVSIGRPVSQVIVYGVNPSDPDRICTSPVVLQRSTNRMAQAAGVYFQIFGHQLTQAAQVVIRKEKFTGGERSVETVATVPARISPSSSEEVIVGTAQWNDPARTIERDALYTAEVVLDKGAKTEFKARRETVPFSYLISEYQARLSMRTGVAPPPAPGQPPPPKPKRGQFGFVLGGAARLTLTVNGQSIYANPNKPEQPQEATDPHLRSYGLNLDPLVSTALADGRYTYVFRATLEGNPQVFEEVEGELTVTDTTSTVRAPGSLVVNGVNIADGGLAVTNTDFEIGGRGLSLSLTRSYNKATATTFNPLGYGWSHNFQVLLVQTKDENGKRVWQMTAGDGAGQTFPEASLKDGKVGALDPHQGSLVPNADGSVDYFTKAHVKYHFPGAIDESSPGFYNGAYMGNLQYVEEPNGNRLTLAYDAKGRMTRVTDSSNRALDFTYELAETPFVGVMSAASRNDISCTNRSQFGLVRNRFLRAEVGKAWRITRVKGPGGLEVSYEYDADGNLERVTRGGADDLSVAAADSVWEYDYGPPAGAQAPANLEHLLMSVKSPDARDGGGHYALYFYDYQKVGVPVHSITMPEGVTNVFDYTLDAANRVTQTVVTDARANKTTYAFDQTGHVTEVTGPRGDVTRMTWNGKGQKATEENAEGRKTTFSYLFDNPAGVVFEGGGKKVENFLVWNLTYSKLESFLDGNKNQTAYTVDPKNGNVRLMKLPGGGTVQYDYYPNGDLRQVTDESNLVTSYEYDAYGNPTRIVQETSPGSTVVTTNTYDVRSRLRSTQSTLGPTTTYTYDALDRAVETTVADPSGFRDALTVTNTYSPGGRLKTQVQTGGGQQLVTALAYDDIGRLRERRETLNGGGGSTQSYTYDKNSNLLTETDRRGVTKTYTYDALNFWTSTTVGGPFGDSSVIADASGPGGVDMVGNPRHVKDQYGQTVTLEYDGLHRLAARRLPNGATEAFGHDANNNVTTARDRKGRTVTTTYDPRNRPATQKDAAGGMTTWTYDDETRTVTVEQAPLGLVRVTQTDGLGRPLREQVKFDAADYVTTYKYSGRSVEIKDPRNFVTTRALSGFGDVGEEAVLGASPAWGVRRDYTAFGGPKSFRDAGGRTTTYTTDSLNRVTSVSHPGGFGETFTYDGGGFVLTHLDRRGVLSTMTYDNLGRPLATRVRDGAQTVAAVTRAYDDAARTETVTDARQHSTVYKYDPIRRLERVTNADGKFISYAYDDQENTLDQTDFKSQHTKFKYDKLDRLVELTDRDGKVTTFDVVDNDGTTRTVTDRRGNKRVETFDALGRLKGVTAGDEPLVSYEYDGNSNRKAVRDGRGNRVDYTFDALNRVTEINHASVRVETFGYDAAGNLTRYADGAGGPVTMTYDPLGHLETRTDGAGNTTRFKFDGGGLLLEKTEPKGDGHRTTYEYNAFGSLRKVTDPRTGAWLIDYFPDQTLKSVTDALGRRVDYEYDALKRLSTVTQHDGAASLVTTYGYDANGNRNFVRDPKGQEVSVTHDSLDRARAASYAGAAGGGPRRFEYGYDPEGNLTLVTETAQAGGTRAYTRTYDKRDRLKTATDPYGRTVAYDYDPADNVTRVTDAADKQTVYHYDNLNRLQSADLGGGGSVAYTLRADGLPSKVTYSSGTERGFTYDAADRLTGVTNSLGSQQSEEFAYDYDANSNRVGEVRKFAGAAFRSVDYDYDALDRLTRAAYTDENVHGLKGDYYDNEDFTQQKLSRIDATVNFEWPDAGQSSPDPQLGGDTFSVRWTGQVKPLHSESYRFSVVSDEGVRLWVDGKLLVDHWVSHEAAEDSGLVTLQAGKKYEIKIEFREGSGDAAARLQWESNSQAKQVIPQSQLYPPAKALDYTYDAAGNRKTEKGRDVNDQAVERSYDYDDLNRLTAARGYQGGEITYGYDPNGNLLTTSQGGVTRARYEYDARDQLRRVLGEGEAEVARYDYDFERRRLSKTLAGSPAQRYVYDGHNLLDEYTESGALNARYDYGDELVRADLPGEGERWYFSDGLGSVTALSGRVEGAQGVTARYEYGAWGQVIGSAGGSANPYLYTGQRLDAETGLMPLGAGERYYSAGLGRFIQQDSWAGEATTGQSLNRYGYAYSNPLRYTDPSGRAPVPVQEPNWVEQSVRSTIRGLFKVVSEPFLWVYDTATVIAANHYGIESEDFRLKSALGSSMQQQIEAGVPPSKVTASGLGGMFYGTVTLGLGPLAESVGGDILAYQDNRITLSEYNERMGEHLGDAIAVYALTKATSGGGKASPRALGENVRTGAATPGPLRAGLSRVGEGLRAFGREVGERTRRLREDVRAAWEESGRAGERVGQAVTPDGQVFGGGGPRLPDLGRPGRAVKVFLESRSNKPFSSGGRGTPTQGAVELQARAWELNRLRTKGQSSYGTTAAMKVRNVKTGEVEVRIATNTPDAVIPEWEGLLRPGEKYVAGPGHAEGTIIRSLGKDWEVVEGGASRNICGQQCAPLIEDLGLEIGGPRFRKKDPTYTDYRMFWRKE